MPVKTIVVGKNDAGQRLDKFLTKLLNIPQPLIYKYLRLKRVRLNGARAEISARLSEGDVLTLYIKDDQFRSPDDAANAYLKVKPRLSVVYEDRNILIADKPPGLLVHPDESEQVNTLLARIQSYLYHKGEYRPDDEHTFSPALCNRIDRNTGGLVIAAKNAESLRILNERIRQRQVRKFYLCVVHGVFEKSVGELQNYLYKDERRNMVFLRDRLTGDARTAVTRYKVLCEKNGMSLVEAEILTGRTHQIRAQFAAAGHPLAGDGKYGTNEQNKNVSLPYQALYSYRLVMDFRSPAGLLEYLNGKSFTAPRVAFAERFLETGRV